MGNGKNIGIISTRLAGTDGVSLEVLKWSGVLKKLGYQVFNCAGELGGCFTQDCLIPEMSFSHPEILALNMRAFQATQQDDRELTGAIHAVAARIRPGLADFITQHNLDTLLVENAMTIPMNLALGVALYHVIEEFNLQVIAHHHDFFWERERYQNNSIYDLLEMCFPIDLPCVRHVTINTVAQRRLQARRRLKSVVIPNVFDYSTLPPGIDTYNYDVRERLGLSSEDLFILQPTRVVRRKGIEMTLELVHRMALDTPRLFISHSAQDEGSGYWEWLQHEADMMNVDLCLIDGITSSLRSNGEHQKVYSLWDIYPHADLITYPSVYEGFGNALLEAVYFKKLIVVNRYPVYNADIAPSGFEFIELDGFVDDTAVKEIHRLLADKAATQAMVNHNFEIARQHFSLDTLECKLAAVIESFEDLQNRDVYEQSGDTIKI